VAGTSVPLPDAQVLPDDFAMDGTNTTLTITNAGTYRLSYRINITAAAALSSRLQLNGTPVAASVITAPPSRDSFAAEVVMTVPANSTLSLELYGLDASPTLQAATLAAVRLS
jgi:type II secretory pathway component PulL